MGPSLLRGRTFLLVSSNPGALAERSPDLARNTLPWQQAVSELVLVFVSAALLFAYAGLWALRFISTQPNQ